MDTNKVYLGNSIDTIKTFPDECIDCVVTSPPYYGLRDYGTGHWEGGDPNCDHESARIKTRFDYDLSEMQAGSKGTDVKAYRRVCPVCGAVRVDEQIGMEETPEEYIQRLVELFREIRRCLKKEGTIWVNLGDSYAGNCSRTSTGFAPKQLMGIPWRFAFAMQSDGWYLRQDIIWHKPNPMPESVTDRCTKSHEYIFLLSKSERYYFDNESIMEECADQSRTNYQSGGRTFGENKDRNDNDFGERSKDWKPRTKNCQYDGQRPNSMHINREMGMPDKEYFVRNKRDVWSVNVRPNTEAHFATYPEMLIRPCILAGCPENGVVLDPFMGSGTTGIVARKLNRNYVGCELNPEYKKMAERRIAEHGENLFNQDL